MLKDQANALKKIHTFIDTWNGLMLQMRIVRNQKARRFAYRRAVSSTCRCENSM